MKEFFQENKKIAKTIREVADLANYLWQKGWAERNAGNISVNLSEILTGLVYGQAKRQPTGRSQRGTINGVERCFSEGIVSPAVFCLLMLFRLNRGIPFHVR